jgi:DNA-binding response OmpR family regulator
MNVLIIEDDHRIADFLQRGLRAEGMRVQIARNGRDGLDFARAAWKENRDGGAATVIVLDLMLPDMTGLDVCQTIRTEQIQLPVLMLTALSLRRRGRDIQMAPSSRLKVADLELDRTTMKVTRAGRNIAVTARELALLELLMSAPGRLFSRERILANVWGVSEDPLTNVVDVYIGRLRSKVDEGFDTPLIHTQRGLGYRLEADPSTGRAS